MAAMRQFRGKRWPGVQADGGGGGGGGGAVNEIRRAPWHGADSAYVK